MNIPLNPVPIAGELSTATEETLLHALTRQEPIDDFAALSFHVSLLTAIIHEMSETIKFQRRVVEQMAEMLTDIDERIIGDGSVDCVRK
jgi:hypothetical protein